MTIGPGDVLLFPPYWVHRVDTSTASISYSFGYDGRDGDAYTLVENSMYIYMMDRGMTELRLQPGPPNPANGGGTLLVRTHRTAHRPARVHTKSITDRRPPVCMYVCMRRCTRLSHA